MKRLKRLLSVIAGRAGLWGLVLCAILAVVALIFQASVRPVSGLDFDNPHQSAYNAETGTYPLPPQDLAWSELPGFGDDHDPAIPPPGSDAVISVAATEYEWSSGSYVEYRIDYADGASYYATLPAWGSAVYRYEPHRPALQRAAPAIFGVGALIAGAIGLLSLVSALFGFDPGAKRLASEAVVDPYAKALLGRWMKRSRFYRLLGGLIGFIVVAARSLDYSIAIDEFVIGIVAGLVVGGALAEFHVLRRKRETVTAADLTVRRVSDFTSEWDRRAMLAVAAGSMCFIVASSVGFWSDSAGRSAAVLALIAVLVAAVTQYAVARRSRPALDPELRSADDLLRFLASTHGFTRPAIALALLLLASAVGRQLDGVVGLVLYISLNLLALCWLVMGRHGRMPKVAAARLAA